MLLVLEPEIQILVASKRIVGAAVVIHMDHQALLGYRVKMAHQVTEKTYILDISIL